MRATESTSQICVNSNVWVSFRLLNVSKCVCKHLASGSKRIKAMILLLFWARVSQAPAIIALVERNSEGTGSRTTSTSNYKEF